MKEEKKDGRIEIKVQKEPETIELKLDGWQMGFFLPYPTVEEAKNWFKKCD